MDLQWPFPMEFHFRDFWCLTFSPERGCQGRCVAGAVQAQGERGNLGDSKNAVRRELLRHPSIRRIAKQLKTAQATFEEPGIRFEEAINHILEIPENLRRPGGPSPVKVFAVHPQKGIPKGGSEKETY